MQAEAVPTLAERAILFYGSEEAVYEKLSGINNKDQNCDGDGKITLPNITETGNRCDIKDNGRGDGIKPVSR